MREQATEFNIERQWKCADYARGGPRFWALPATWRAMSGELKLMERCELSANGRLLAEARSAVSECDSRGMEG
jgi:hypothetical protein